MKLLFLIAFLPLFAFTQTALDSNKLLRIEYFEYKKEGEELYKKASQHTIRIERYKREIDSLNSELNFGKLLHERMILMRYRDTIECNKKMTIHSIVPFDDVMPKDNDEIPYDDITLFGQLQLPAKMYNLVLDSLPVQEENKKLNTALLSASMCNRHNQWLLENFPDIERRYLFLKQRLPELSVSFAKTTLRVKSFNQQLADTLAIWRKECQLYPDSCKICSEFDHEERNSGQQKIMEENKQSSEDMSFTDPDIPAEYPGGNKALKEYLYVNLQYPERAKKLGLEGKSYIQFKISVEGTVSDVVVYRPMPDCPECDAEAKRLVENMPNWIPGSVGGKPKMSTYRLPISFKLP